MLGFFTGWKRKIGIATLVLCCISSGGWIRSLVIRDEFLVILATQMWDVYSTEGTLIFERTVDLDRTDDLIFSFDSTPLSQLGNMFPLSYAARGLENQVDRDFCGFTIITATSDWDSLCVLVVPYWSIVIPLALLSAYFLLSKPRQRKQPAHLTELRELASASRGDPLPGESSTAQRS